jgi:hypothetical protein
MEWKGLMKEIHEKLFTPDNLDEQKILSKTEQWKRRKSGELNYYKVGTKIFYSEKHLAEFFQLFEHKDSAHEE